MKSIAGYSNAEELIPRALIFSDPKYSLIKISPNSKYLSYLAPFGGALNIWIRNFKKNGKAKPITNNKKRGITNYFWAYNNKDILYIDDHDGNEDWRIYKVNITNGDQKTLISIKNVQAKIIATSYQFPCEILIGLNNRRSEFHDLYLLNIDNGTLKLIYKNNFFTDFICDEFLMPKIGIEFTQSSKKIVYTLNNKFVKKKILIIEPEDIITTLPISLNKTSNTLYILNSIGRNTTALTSMNIANHKSTIIAKNDKADIRDVMIHPTDRTIEAYYVTHEKTDLFVIDNKIKEDVNYLKQIAEGDLEIISRSLDNKTWIIKYTTDIKPPHYYYYDRNHKKAVFLFSSRPELDNFYLNNMQPVTIESRDGLKLISYLSLPRTVKHENGLSKIPVPLILVVHGGPNSRDEWGYNSIHQWLTNRGYAVLSINFRGSTGFGKIFTNAGNGEWGAKMHDDLIDGIEWAIKNGITMRNNIAIMGGSYGGYATLIGLTKTPDIFSCGIDIVGISNLITFLDSIPPYWQPFYALLKKRLGGDPKTEYGRAFLMSRSPINFIANIKKPLLIGQGANDPRVKQAESEQIVEAIKSKHIPVTYILYPDEGHGFQRAENRLSFYAVAETFLAQHLKGKLEPIKQDFKNSTIQFKAGNNKYISELKKNN